jgi:transcriptional antiterminator NusG
MLTNWYALAVTPGREAKVRQTILNRLEKRGIKIPALALICPEEEVIVGRDRTRKMRMKLPGYILLHCRRLEPEAINQISMASGVLEFLGGNDHPTPLPSDQVDKMIGVSKAPTPTKALYNVGDQVTIIDGPFSDFTATITDLNHEQLSAKVEIEIFGRQTPAQVSLHQIRR